MHCVGCNQMSEIETNGGVFIHDECSDSTAGLIVLVDALRSMGFKAPVSIRAKVFFYRLKACLASV